MTKFIFVIDWHNGNIKFSVHWKFQPEKCKLQLCLLQKSSWKPTGFKSWYIADQYVSYLDKTLTYASNVKTRATYEITTVILFNIQPNHLITDHWSVCRVNGQLLLPGLRPEFRCQRRRFRWTQACFAFSVTPTPDKYISMVATQLFKSRLKLIDFDPREFSEDVQHRRWEALCLSVQIPRHHVRPLC